MKGNGFSSLLLFLLPGGIIEDIPPFPFPPLSSLPPTVYIFFSNSCNILVSHWAVYLLNIISLCSDLITGTYTGMKQINGTYLGMERKADNIGKNNHFAMKEIPSTLYFKNKNYDNIYFLPLCCRTSLYQRYSQFITFVRETRGGTDGPFNCYQQHFLNSYHTSVFLG